MTRRRRPLPGWLREKIERKQRETRRLESLGLQVDHKAQLRDLARRAEQLYLDATQPADEVPF